MVRKSTIKKIISGFLGVALSFSCISGTKVFAVSNSSDASKNTESVEEKIENLTLGTEKQLINGKKPEEIKGDIRLSVWGSDSEIKVDEEVIEAFNKVFPNVNVELEVNNENYLTKVETEFLAGTAPDVIYGHPKYFQKWCDQDLLMDLTPFFEQSPELFDESIYLTKLYDSFTYKDKYYTTINGADTHLVFYNVDMFNAAGVPLPTENWTWDEFLDACKKLTKDNDGDGIMDQYAFSGGRAHDSMQAFLGSFGGSIYDDPNNPTKVTLLENKGNKEGLQMLYDLTFKYNYAPTGEQSEALQGGFDQGKIAMDLNGVWNVVYRSQPEDGLQFKYGLTMLPKAAENAHTTALMAGYAIPKTTQNPEAAWALASFMQSREGQRILAKTGLITVIMKEVASSDEVINIPNGPENHILRVTSLENAINCDPKLRNWQETLDTAWYPPFDKLWNKQQDVDETLKQLQDALTDMLKKALE